jgi:hypothetical protein
VSMSSPFPKDVSRLADGSVDNTEFEFMDGVTSAIQPQLDAKAPLVLPIVSTGINYAMAASDYMVKATAAVTITLPSSPATGKQVIVKATNAGTVTVNPAAGNIDDAASLSLTGHQSVSLVYDGVQWRIV